MRNSAKERRACRERWETYGVTLIELLVVMVIMGVMASVVGLAAKRWTPMAKPAKPHGVVTLRSQAIARGRSVAGTVSLGARTATVRALPDGRLLGAAAIGVDPLTGLPDSVRHSLTSRPNR